MLQFVFDQARGSFLPEFMQIVRLRIRRSTSLWEEAAGCFAAKAYSLVKYIIEHFLGVTVLVSSGCCNKFHKVGGLEQQRFFSVPVLEAKIKECLHCPAPSEELGKDLCQASLPASGHFRRPLA